MDGVGQAVPREDKSVGLTASLSEILNWETAATVTIYLQGGNTEFNRHLRKRDDTVVSEDRFYVCRDP